MYPISFINGSTPICNSKKRSKTPICCLKPPTLGPPPLQDLRVLLATTTSTASRLCPSLIEMGARPFHIRSHTISPLPTEQLTSLEDAVLRLSSFDYLFLLSHAAVDAFVTALLSFCFNDSQAASLALSASQIQIVCLPQVARYVRHILASPPDMIIPTVSIDSLPVQLDFNSKILILTPSTDLRDVSSATQLACLLNENGYQPTILPSYRLSLPSRKCNAIEYELLVSGDIEAVIFESEEEAVALGASLNSSEKNQISDKLSNEKLVMIGKRGIAQVVSKDFQNDNVIEVPQLITDKELIDTLVNEIAEIRNTNMSIWLPEESVQ